MVVGDTDCQGWCGDGGKSLHQRVSVGVSGGGAAAGGFLEPRTAADPVAHDAFWRVFQPAEVSAGEVTEWYRQQRHGDVPFGDHPESFGRGIVAAPGELGAHGEDAVDEMAGWGEAEDEA